MTAAEAMIVTLTMTMSSDGPGGIGRGRRRARALGAIRHGGNRPGDVRFTLGEIQRGAELRARGMVVGLDERQMEEDKGATFEGERYQR